LLCSSSGQRQYGLAFAYAEEGWADLPRGTRWLAGGIAAVLLALVVVCVLFVPAADWLAHHDVGSAGGSLHETALDNARGRLLTLGAACSPQGLSSSRRGTSQCRGERLS
jgi:hypothetical protein